MSRQIEEGQELSQEDYDWLKERMRVEEALNEWGCTLADGVGDSEQARDSEPIVATSTEELQGAEPAKAQQPGTLESVHPEQVGFIEGTEVLDEDEELMSTDDDSDEVPPYSEWEKADLQAEANRRELTITGTGKNGNVLVSDLIAALEEHDASSE
jgi:hypothetical protein